VGPNLAYRRDIDGLRGVAVLLVLAFHSNLGWVPGGFVGVDVFFVISGYLISGIIFAQIDAGTFSLAAFYGRRIRRIVPALVAMMLATLLAGMVLLYPSEWQDLGKSAIAATLSASNLFFWSTANYFDAPSNTKPLLHTWSLGVEEQFYLAFPLLMVLLAKVRRPWFRDGVLLLAAGLSFWVSQRLLFGDPAGAFYLPQSRVWELMVGALLASGMVSAPSARWAREAVAGGGLLAIAAAALLTRPTMPFPGAAALAPCLGAGALILAGGGSSASRLLGSRPLVFAGLISYSLYLWHWPMIVFQRIAQVIHTGAPDVVDRALLLAAILAVATLSWRWIEQPFRHGRPRLPLFGALSPLGLASAGAGLVALCGVTILADHGAPGRYSPAAIRLASYLDYDPAPDMRQNACFLSDRAPFAAFDQATCLHRRDGHPAFLLFGDSHAGHLYPGLVADFGAGTDILQATATGCKPLVTEIGAAKPCARMIDFVFDDYLHSNRVDLVLLSARWDEDDLAGIAATRGWLLERGIRAVFIGPTPEYDLRLPGLLARVADQAGGEAGLDPSGAAKVGRHLDPLFAAIDHIMRQLFVAGGTVSYLSAYDGLCPAGACATLVGGEPVFYDRGHLTRAGSLLLVDRLRGALARLAGETETDAKTGPKDAAVRPRWSPAAAGPVAQAWPARPEAAP
jgi:peptidoglycan/LPS O-acetylase OafA/YrhL